MTANPHDASPAYGIAPDGTVELNAAGQALVAQYHVTKSRFDALQRSWAQAEIAALFVRHPAVRIVVLNVFSSWEYDDAGEHYLRGSCLVKDVCLDPDSPQIEEFMDDGKPDSELAAEVLESELDDTNHDLALELLGADGIEDRLLPCKREEVLAQFGLT